MSRLKWPLMILLRYYRNLGLRVSLYAVLSLLASFLGPAVRSLLSAETTRMLDFDSVMPVLTILATSMLAVSTFSLNIMVSAHRAAAGTTTPRVHRILLDDTTTQSVLATFIGAFVYSLASIVLIQTGIYAAEAAVVVMAVTVVVIALVVVAMLRWIGHLSELGSVDDALRTATARARDVLENLAGAPALGANPITPATVMPADAVPVRAPVSGYLQLVDVAALEDKLPGSAVIYLAERPGRHMLEGEIVAHVSGAPDGESIGALLSALTFGDQRTYEQDATWGLVVLSEIAAKALSPGINDSGTAIATIAHLKELLWDVGRTESETEAPVAPRVFVPVPEARDLVEAAFAPIARDGAGALEVAVTLREALKALAGSEDAALAEAAEGMAERALAHAGAAGLLDAELDRLRGVTVDASA